MAIKVKMSEKEAKRMIDKGFAIEKKLGWKPIKKNKNSKKK